MPPRKRSAPLIGTILAALVLVAVGANVITNAPPAAAATTAGCGKAPGLNSGTHTIQSGGKSRSFILRLPDSYNNTYPHRLAFGFHWLGGTASRRLGRNRRLPLGLLRHAVAVEQHHDLRRPTGHQQRLGQHQR